MTRDIDVDTLAAAESPTTAPVALVKLDFPSGVVGFWTGFGDFEHDGQTYVGTGDLGFIGPIDEDSDLTRNTMEIGLRGLPNDVVSAVLGEQYQGRDCDVLLGFLDMETRQFIGEPMTFTGKMDYPTIGLGETCQVVLKIEDEFAVLDKPKVRRYNDGDQQSRYPGDKFFQFAEQSTEKQIAWGQKLIV